MAARHGHSYKPKPKEISCEIKIISDRHEEKQDERHFAELFKAKGYKTADLKQPVEDGNIQFIQFKIKQPGFGKAGVFESVRQAWCSSRRPANSRPCWLEAAEDAKKIFNYKAERDVTSQVLKPKSFSFGSFYDRQTYIRHWSSEQEASIVTDAIDVEFEHDSKSFTITHEKQSGGISLFDDLFAGGQSGNFLVAFEYKQLENYVLVDENTTKQVVDLYFPLQWPPKVEAITTSDAKHNTRSTHMWNHCSREVLGGSSVLHLQFPLSKDSTNSPALELLTRLSCRMGFTIYFAAVNTRNPRGKSEVPEKPKFSEFKVGYALECLLSRGFKVQDRVSRAFYDILREATIGYESLRRRANVTNPDRVCKALYHLTSFVETNRFCPLEYTLKHLLRGNMKQLTLVDFELPKHYVYVPRLIVTPTQNYLVPPELVAMNRVIREYGHQYTMRIAFRDEDFSKLMSSGQGSLNNVLEERVIKLLAAGLDFCGRHFDFLACSNSQLRDHGAWLYANNQEHTAEKIRGSLGELDQIKCVATYVSRMGQCFSSTKESVKVSMDEGCIVEEIPDIKREYENVYFSCCDKFRTGTYLFSDGVGKISSALAKKVSRILDFNPVPSAFQIRYGGCKGMLAVDSFPHGDTTEILQYRKSMKKFDSRHSALEICERTRPNLLYLNRQCITLLSGLGVKDEAFIGLQDTMLRHLASMLLFETVAVEMLRRTNIAGGLKVSALSHSGVNVTSEPFIRSLLLALYNSRLGDLRRRSRIAIPESYGRLLMGVMDETGTLEYGQIFVRYSKLVSEPGKDVKTLLGSVMVSKNPCFHGGDMRKFEAVDVRALHHLVDCIVFPSKGPRPHPDEMSGSDLDGDKYFVTWYEKFVCQRENEPPMDFMPAPKKLLDRPVEVNDMIQFVANYIKNDQLGVIANAHLVHADFQEKGIFSDECVKLAHMHSDAVDFPKTGECPTLPQELRPVEYPDFMMKTGKPQKSSEKVLGKLFRKCKALDRSQRFKQETAQGRVSVDPDLIVPGHEDFIEEAEASLDKYNSKLTALMSLYGLKNEGEVITGCLLHVNSRLAGKTDEKFEVAQMIQASVSSLRKNTKREFYDQFDGEGKVMEDYESTNCYADEILSKASAWYVVTYQNAAAQSREENQAGNDVTLLSFPWVVDRLLLHIKKTKHEERESLGQSKEHALRGTSELVADQATDFFNERRDILVNDFEMKTKEKLQLSSLLASLHKATSLSLCGASLTGIHARDDKPTQIQLYAHLRWGATEQEQRMFLDDRRRLIRPHYNRADLQTIPPCLILEKVSLLKQQYHISADSGIMLKGAYISLHVQRCPSLLHVLLIVAHWGCRRKLTGRHYGADELAVLFLLFCEKKGIIHEVSQPDILSHAESLLTTPLIQPETHPERIWQKSVLVPGEPGDYTGFKDDANPGIALMKFFEHYSTADQEGIDIAHVMNPTVFYRKERLFPGLPEEAIQRFSDAALHVFHEIAQCRGLDILLMAADTEKLNKVQETLTLPKNTWGAVRFAEEFVGSMLSEMTDASVSIRSVKRSPGYTIEVFGNYLELYKVQNELEKIEKTCQSYIYDHVVTGAPRFIFGSQSGDLDAVTFKQLKKGDCAINLSSPSVVGDVNADGGKFLRAFEEQMSRLRNECLPCVHGKRKLQFRVEFGSIYAKVPTLGLVGVASRNVGNLERMLDTSADPQNRSIQARNAQNRGGNQMSHKFVPLSPSSDRWFSAFGGLLTQETSDRKEEYIVEAKEGKNTIRFVLDSQMEFIRLKIPPVTWLQTDVKTPRPVTSKSRDVDFRLSVSSPRELESEATRKVLASRKFEKYMMEKAITRHSSTVLEVNRSLYRTIQFVRHETTRMYRVPGFAEECDMQLRVCDVRKYDFRNCQFPSSDRPSCQVQLFATFDGNDSDAASSVARDMWSAAKQLLPYID